MCTAVVMPMEMCVLYDFVVCRCMGWYVVRKMTEKIWCVICYGSEICTWNTKLPLEYKVIDAACRQLLFGATYVKFFLTKVYIQCKHPGCVSMMLLLWRYQDSQ